MIAGQYRFHRSDLLEWATTNKVLFSLKQFDEMENDSQPLSTLSESLEEGGIFYGLQATDKNGALRALVQVLRLPDDIDAELVLRLFWPEKHRLPQGSVRVLRFPMLEIL